MSLERRDVRFFLDDEVHKALRAICAASDQTLAEWVESLVEARVVREVHDAMMLADAFRDAGISRSLAGSPEKAAK